MNAATANLVIAVVWALLALLLAMFLTAIVRTPQELAGAGPADHAAPIAPVAAAAARYSRTPYTGRHARGRTGHGTAGPPWDPAPEPPVMPH